MEKIYMIQSKAQRKILKGDLNAAIDLLKTAVAEYSKLLEGIDREDEDNINLIKSVEKLQDQASRRQRELEVVIKSRQGSNGINSASGSRQIGGTGGGGKDRQGNDGDNIGNKGNNGDSQAQETEEDKFKRQLIRLINSFLGETGNASASNKKVDQNIMDLRQKLKILQINGNNIDLMTTPEQKLKYENDLLHKIQANYDVKMSQFEEFISKLTLLVNGADISGFEVGSVVALQQQQQQQQQLRHQQQRTDDNDSNDELYHEDTNSMIEEMKRLKLQNKELESEVNKLNDRWNELVESAKRRKERNLYKN